MLSLIEVSCFEDRIPFLGKAHQDGFYIVSDLKSKLQFQKFLLKKNRFILESSVTRARDFYIELLQLNLPEYKLISIPELQFLFKYFMRKQKNLPYINPSLYNNILISLQSFLPFLTHPSGSETFEQWIKNPNQKRWFFWYSWIKPFWQQLNEKKVIEESLAKYILIDQPLKKLSKPLYVDLGFSIDAVEVELLASLSTLQDVYILCPPPLNPNVYPKSHQIYELLKEKQHQFTPLPQKKQHITKKTILKFPSMLEEVQFITQQLRKDLLQHSPSQLTVLAPNMEAYWPVLKSYLNKEGLPISKGNQYSLLSYPQVQKWLSLLHFYAGNISYNNIEYAVQTNKFQESSFRIRSQYYYSDRKKDFHLSEKIEEQPQSDSIDTQQFLKWIFNLWSHIAENTLHEKLDQKIQHIGHKLKILFSQKSILVSDGIELLEHLLINNVLHTPSETPKGIQFMSINATTSITAQKVYMIGLDHQSCLTPSLSLFTEKEVQAILNDLGFHCHYLNPNQREYEIINFLKFFKGEVYLSYSETHFSGAPLHPSKAWLLENQNNKANTSIFKDETVWSSIQKYQYSPLPQKFSTALNQNFKWSQGQKIPLKKLSASRIKQYISCPFIYLSQNIYHLEDTPYRDNHLPPLNKGHLIHELFSKIQRGLLKNSEEINQWLQNIKSNYPVLDKTVWNIYQEQFIHIANRFMKNEEKINQILPQLQTLGTELEFEGYWNFKDKKLSAEGDILINGRIDRVDCYQDEYLVLDYKSSLNNVYIIKSWIDKMDIQMPLYIQAVESNLLKEKNTPNSSVSLSSYVHIKNFEWKGFVSKNSELKKVFKSRSRSIVEESVKKEILKTINNKIQQYILKIKENEFQPQPHDKKICNNCSWRYLCRAPHLNS